VQQKETDNHPDLADLSRVPASGRLLALDLGTKRIGVAITDETRIVATPLDPILRTSWKKLLLSVRGLISDFDAKGLVIGLPFGFEGEETPMFHEALRLARNCALSLEVPVFLQDERATSYEARGRLWQEGHDRREASKLVDSEAATIILSDFLGRLDE